ncbi:fibroblast growth factor-binding protein 1 [Dasypus novemcinctus]|uniref:fibroblast growth factor-binding protein 1 n=1 Tax=Dasypus novemcinctus TaxID=9361 RepID=UPI0003291408|nr:fibroblast growth factor-binding protein 1 [Dasypus novemcinctus]
MRIQRLALLSLVLLAAQVLLVEGEKAGKEKDAPGKPEKRQRGRAHRRPPQGRFTTPDLAECRWAVTELQGGSATLHVQCTQKDKEFSCHFSGHLDSCLQSVKKANTVWRQIGRHLKGQKNICEDSRGVVTARVCRKKFPEAGLKLLNSTLIKERKPSQGDMKTKEVQESTPSSPGTPQTVSPQGPKCVKDPEIEIQRRAALEYCGEPWLAFCKFIFTMLQDNSC